MKADWLSQFLPTYIVLIDMLISWLDFVFLTQTSRSRLQQSWPAAEINDRNTTSTYCSKWSVAPCKIQKCNLIVMFWRLWMHTGPRTVHALHWIDFSLPLKAPQCLLRRKKVLFPVLFSQPVGGFEQIKVFSNLRVTSTVLAGFIHYTQLG